MFLAILKVKRIRVTSENYAACKGDTSQSTASVALKRQFTPKSKTHFHLTVVLLAI